jgi:hypothetical protein
MEPPGLVPQRGSAFRPQGTAARAPQRAGKRARWPPQPGSVDSPESPPACVRPTSKSRMKLCAPSILECLGPEPRPDRDVAGPHLCPGAGQRLPLPTSRPAIGELPCELDEVPLRVPEQSAPNPHHRPVVRRRLERSPVLAEALVSGIDVSDLQGEAHKAPARAGRSPGSLDRFPEPPLEEHQADSVGLEFGPRWRAIDLGLQPEGLMVEVERRGKVVADHHGAVEHPSSRRLGHGQ